MRRRSGAAAPPPPAPWGPRPRTSAMSMFSMISWRSGTTTVMGRNRALRLSGSSARPVKRGREVGPRVRSGFLAPRPDAGGPGVHAGSGCSPRAGGGPKAAGRAPSRRFTLPGRAPMYPGFMVMKALVPSSSGISTPSAATKLQPATAAWLAPDASRYSRPLLCVLGGCAGGVGKGTGWGPGVGGLTSCGQLGSRACSRPGHGCRMRSRLKVRHASAPGADGLLTARAAGSCASGRRSRTCTARCTRSAPGGEGAGKCGTRFGVLLQTLPSMTVEPSPFRPARRSGPHLWHEAVELVEAAPRPAGGEALEDVPHRAVVHLWGRAAGGARRAGGGGRCGVS
jgi:hypothetical protein